MLRRNPHIRVSSLLAHWSLVFLAVATVSAQQATDTSQSKPPASSSITGRVVNESGQPLPGVAVSVGAWGAPDARRTATDNEGYFKAEGLDAGVYRIFANSPSYISEAPLPGDSNERQPLYRPGDSVTIKLMKGGVIAGTVTNAAGDAIVNVVVRAYRVRDAEGRPLSTAGSSRERLTDDRGYYRLYGLQPGSYVVSAGGQGQYVSGYAANPYGNDVPTYAPASTRDAAVEFLVRSGEEATADIRYRGEPGHSISGRVTGVQPNPTYIPGVLIVDTTSHALIAVASAMDENRGFQVNGVPDGDYEIAARAGGGPNGDASASATKRISVKGADVTGLELALAPLASISGRVNLELDPKLNCGRHRETALRETLISTRRDPDQPNSKDKTTAALETWALVQTLVEVPPNDKSEIVFRNLIAGTYRVDARLPGAGWYVSAISLVNPDQKPPVRKATEANIARDGLALKPGDKVSGLTVTITEGAASIRGSVSVGDGQRLPQNVRVYLVPAEREASENVLRFFETRVENDGTFTVGNITPGRYLIVARPAEENDPLRLRPIKQDSALRAKLLHEAEASKKEISFKPCERTVDYDLQFAPAVLPK
jgi:hypothetical protein